MNRTTDGVAVFILSLLVGLPIICFGYIILYGDTFHYLSYARNLAQGNFAHLCHLYFRTPGYPTLLILTGFTTTASLAGILVWQMLSGAAIPVLGYATVSRLNRNCALALALALICSLLPYFFINTIYPDQFYMFFLLLAAFLLTSWLVNDRSVAVLYGLAATCAMLWWLRPIGVTIAGLCLLLALFRRGALKHVLICTVLLAGAQWSFSYYQGRKAGKRRGDVASMNGRQLFIQVYLHSQGGAFAAASGDAAAALRKHLVAYFSAHARDIKKRFAYPMSNDQYHELFGRFEGKPEEQVAEMLTHPHLTYFWIMFCISDVSDVSFGPRGDDLFLRASLEFVREHPQQYLHGVVQSYAGLVWGPARKFGFHDYAAGGMAPTRVCFEPFDPECGVEAGSDMRGSKIFFANRCQARPSWMVCAQSYFVACYPIVLRVSYLLMIVGVAGFLFVSGQARTMALVVFLLHTCNVLSLSMFVDPQFRYQVQSIPLAMVGAGIGLYRIATWLTWCLRMLSYRDAEAIHWGRQNELVSSQEST
jgi:hypothetical protein